jgi:hypothetical protein
VWQARCAAAAQAVSGRRVGEVATEIESAPLLLKADWSDNSDALCQESRMVWLWLGFTVLVVILLVLDLGVFHRHAHEVTLREASLWTVVWITLGLSFTGLVYVIYDGHWFGAHLASGSTSAGQG